MGGMLIFDKVIHFNINQSLLEKKKMEESFECDNKA
jgi:hypothetical protein